MVALAAAVAVPVGVGVAIWLVEFGRESKLALAVRYFIDVMTGVPSIVFGLFVYITLVVRRVRRLVVRRAGRARSRWRC